MKLSSVKKFLVNAIENNGEKFVTLIQGAPGIGKSDLVREIFREKFDVEKDYLIDLRLGDKDPSDVGGHHLPDFETKRTIRTIPDWLPTDPKAKGILFIDELDHAPPSVQTICYQIFNDSKVGGHVIPEGIWIVAASNTRSDGGIHFQIAKPIRNRIVTINMELPVGDWLTYAEEQKVNPLVTAFIRENAHYLSFEDKVGNVTGAFASPRSWMKVDELLNFCDPVEEDALEIFSGTIGATAAEKFIEFCNLAKGELDAEKILYDFKGSKLEFKKEDMTNKPLLLYTFERILNLIREDEKGMKGKKLGGVLHFIDHIQDSGLQAYLFQAVSKINPSLLDPTKKDEELYKLKYKIVGNITDVIMN